MTDKQDMTDNEISYLIRGAVFSVYNALGPGLLESVYERVMAYELKAMGLEVKTQVEVPILYDGKSFGCDLRADIVVNDQVILELKSVECLREVHFKQLLTYLRLTDKRLGLLINFNEYPITKGIHRVANNVGQE